MDITKSAGLSRRQAREDSADAAGMAVTVPDSGRAQTVRLR